MRKAVRTWLWIFLAGYAVMMALWLGAMALATPKPSGDMTRMGHVSEQAFGWRQPQPALNSSLRINTPLAQADVLVIGDSFSNGRVWQSELVKRGLRVATLEWSQIGEVICSDFDAWLQATGFKGRRIFIESIERIVNTRVKRSESCVHQGPRVEVSSKATHAMQTRLVLDHNWEAGFLSGWQIQHNTLKLRQAAGDLRARDKVWARKVARGCEQFSHPACDKALFYGDDIDNGPLDAETAARLQRISQRHAQLPIIWVVIPNKTSVYLQPDFSKAFVTAFAPMRLGPDLYAFAQEQRWRVRDFYLPNDTHMSAAGMLQMGALLSHWVDGTPASAAPK